MPGSAPELARLLSDASAGTVSVLVVTSVDRLGCAVPVAPQVVADLDDVGVIVYAADRGACLLADTATLPDILITTIRPRVCGRRIRR